MNNKILYMCLIGMISFMGINASEEATANAQRAENDLAIAKLAFEDHVASHPQVKLSKIESRRGVVDRRLYNALSYVEKPQYLARKRLHNTVMEAEIELNKAKAELELELAGGRAGRARRAARFNAFDAMLAERSRAEKEDVRFGVTRAQLQREVEEARGLLAGGSASSAPAFTYFSNTSPQAYEAEAALQGARKAIEESRRYLADYKPSAGSAPAVAPVGAGQSARRRSTSPVRREASIMPAYPPSPKTTRLVKADLGNLPELPPSPKSDDSDKDSF